MLFRYREVDAMSILEALMPRTVTVTGARVVRLGLSETPHGRYKRMTPEQVHANYEAKRRADRERKRAKR